MSLIFPFYPVVPPVDIQNHLEEVWRDGNFAWGPTATPLSSKPTPTANTYTTTWEHLVYAYLIENTSIYEIFAKVIHEYTSGENLSPTFAANGQKELNLTGKAG